MSTGNYVLGMRVDNTSYLDVVQRVTHWAQAQDSRYICVANVHMTMEAWDSIDYRKIVNSADLVTPDGMPLVWALRLLGLRAQQRVYGPDLTLHLCEMAEAQQIPVALYGGAPSSLKDFQAFLSRRFPGLQIVCTIAPPFRPLTPQEDDMYTAQLADSGAQLIFVGTGCPKQERWMAAHKGRLRAVMVGVGAAFDFHSGRVKQAPHWMQNLGLEWLFRLWKEPGRLWRRYLKHNPRFLAFFCLQMIGLLSKLEDNP